MLKIIKKIFTMEQSRFIIVGVLNTIIGLLVMMTAYNIFHLGYWISSALEYIIGSTFSYFANKHFTFHAEYKSKGEVIRFTVNIVLCYFLSYSIAKPVIQWLLNDFSLSVSFLEQVSLFFGTGIFMVFNYFGQKFFVFRKKE